ncbi:MAG: hypothetical protein J7K54_03170, partial [Candidatus Aenigmarchaeota archaeon]|nr:hypothetical protein [Candidatus Aenigmarchaeota archaeon]
WFNLTNSTGDIVSDGENFSRQDVLNASALWNASGVNSSYVWVNDSGHVNEFWFNHADSNDNWTNATLNFSNCTLFPLGGNVSVRLKAFDDFFQQNYTRDALWFYLWSNASIGGITVNGSIHEENITIVNGTTHLVSCFVNDTYSGAGVPGYNVSFYINGSFNGSVLTNSSGWANFVYTDASPKSGNYSVLCNITDDPRIRYNASNDNASNATVYVIADSDRPYLAEDWFEYEGHRLENKSGSFYETGYYRNVTLVVNASDSTSRVESVIAEVTSDGPTVINHTLARGPDGLWRFSFDNSDPTRSVNSSMSFYFYLTDAGGNMNYTNVPGPGGTLNPNATMHINLTHWESNKTVYNRGENLTFSAYDVNWFIYERANWTLTVLGYNETSNTSSSGENATYFNYTLNVSAPVGNWTAWINASETLNNGSAAFAFNVSDVLTVEFTSPSESSYYQPNQELEPHVVVKTARGTAVPWDVTVNLTCSGNTFTLIKSGSEYILNTSDSTNRCNAAGTYSTSFSITVNVTDPKNNTAPLTTLNLKTVDKPSDTYNGGGGGSSYSSPPPACNCTSWKNLGCGSGNCTDGEMYQERVCTPAGCEAESRCIPLSVCTDRKNFKAAAETDSIDVTQGKNATAIFTVENTGNKDFSLGLLIDLGCCEAFPPFSSFSLPQKTQVTVPVVVHAPLSQEPGEYVMTVTFTEKEFNKTAGMRIVVQKNDDMARLEALETQREKMQEQTVLLESMGIDVTGLKRRMEQLGNSLDAARNAAEADNVDMLAQHLSLSEDFLAAIEDNSFIPRLQGLIYMSWPYMAAEIVLAVMMLYTVTGVIMPPLKRKRRMSHLEGRIKSIKDTIKETERDYTQRKIDEDTYRKNVQKRKDEMTMLQSELKQLMQHSEMEFFSFGSFRDWMLRREGNRKAGTAPVRRASAPQKEKVTSEYLEWKRKYIEAKEKDDGGSE